MWSLLLKYVVYGVVIVPLDYIIIKGVDKVLDLSAGMFGRKPQEEEEPEEEEEQDQTTPPPPGGVMSKIYAAAAAPTS
jgi:hypothetical protein